MCCEGVGGEQGGRNLGKAERDEVRLLPGAVPGRHLHDPHASRQPVLPRQPHRALFPHLPHLVPRLLPAGGVRREGQPRDHHPAGARRLPAARRRDDAADARLHPDTRWVVCALPASTCTDDLNLFGEQMSNNKKKISIDTEVRCVGAHPPFWPFEPARVKPN